jgi:hypothetical protein
MSDVTPGRFLVRLNLVCTAVFVVVLAVAVPLRHHTAAQVLVAVVSLVLFAIGVVTGLWAYTSALERSRTEEVGVANLFLLTGPTAPPRVKRTMAVLLGVQTVAALAGASVGAAGLSGNQINALAFGVLVPMLGIGVNGVWAARYGSFGPRVKSAGAQHDRKRSNG